MARAGDNLMERTEFIQEWLRLGFGTALSASALFDHADTNSDGILSSNPDFGRIYTFFDLNRMYIYIYIISQTINILWNSCSFLSQETFF